MENSDRTSARDLLSHAREALTKCGVGGETARVLIGVSGGVDSIALLHVLSDLRKEGALQSLHVAHLDHALREESALDAEFVADVARALDLPLHTERIDVTARAKEEGKGIEEAARDVRYDFFARIAQQHALTVVVTAHTASDQVETILMNLIRGAGVHGLAGIPEQRELGELVVVRPWLRVRRDEIERFASGRGITWREDTSNRSSAYTRNRVRSTVIPALRTSFPHRDIEASFLSLSDRMREIEDLLRSNVESAYATFVDASGALSSEMFSTLHPALHHGMLQTWIHTQHQHQLSNGELARLRELARVGAGAVQLREGLIVRAEHDRLIMAQEPPPELDRVALITGGVVSTVAGIVRSMLYPAPIEITAEVNVAFFDADAIGPLVVRRWESGERMRPFGMKGQSKLVSDLLTDAGVLGHSRLEYPVVALESGEILWIPGVRQAERGRVSAQTSGVLVLTLEPLSAK